MQVHSTNGTVDICISLLEFYGKLFSVASKTLLSFGKVIAMHMQINFHFISCHSLAVTPTYVFLQIQHYTIFTCHTSNSQRA